MVQGCRVALRHKPVANIRLCPQMSGHGRVVLHLFAQVGHVYAHVVRVFGMAWPPHGLEQLVVGDDTVGLGRQVREQLVFDGCEVQGFAAMAFDMAVRAALHRAAGQVHGDGAELDDGSSLGA